MTTPADKLFADYEDWARGYVVKLIDKLDPSSCLLVDGQAEQVGLIGLMRASRKYKKSKKVNFATYAAKCITNAVLAELESEGRQPDTTDQADENEAPEADEPQPQPDLKKYLCLLKKPIHKRLIQLRYVVGLNQTQTASRLGVTHGRVWQMEQDALEIIRRGIGDAYDDA